MRGPLPLLHLEPNRIGCDVESTKNYGDIVAMLFLGPHDKPRH